MERILHRVVGVWLICVFSIQVGVADDQRGKRPIRFEDVYGPEAKINPFANPSPRFSWLPDGQHLLRKQHGRHAKVHVATGEESPSFNSAAIADSLQLLPGIGSDRAEKMSQLAGAIFNPNHDAAVIAHDNDLYLCRLDGSHSCRLTDADGKEELAAFSPDGQFVAFVRRNDLYLVDVATQTERRLTTDGSELVHNGIADWVYYEEVFDRNERTFWFSGDGKQIAFLRFDDRPVTEYVIPNNVRVAQTLERTRYPQAGTPNPLVSVGVAGVEGTDVRWVDLSAYPADDRLVVRVGWLPDHRSLYLYVQNRIQTWLDVLVLKPGNAVPERLLRQTTSAWVNVPGPPRFLKDGSFLLTDEKSGFRHISRYSATGQHLMTLTAGEWEVDRIDHVDEAGSWVYFTANEASPLERHLYRVPIGGGAPQRLTPDSGTHRVRFSATGKHYFDSFSNDGTPPITELRDADGKLLRRLHESKNAALEPFQLGKLKRVQIQARDGVLLHATLLKPPNFESSRQFPVWCRVYGGPDYPMLTNRWAKSHRLFDEVLAAQGIVVVRIDPRSAGAGGIRNAWQAYRQLGRIELRDLEDAVGWLKSQSWVDGNRIGIEGHSYGGFLAAYALTHSRLFSAGIAGAPVTDWRNYDTIYTERYMDTPAANPEGYDASSVVKAAGNLHGRLLLMHGLLDDNVHAQHSIRLAAALQKANQQFEIMIYPRARHGIFGTHSARLRYDFILKTMQPGRGSK